MGRCHHLRSGFDAKSTLAVAWLPRLLLTLPPALSSCTWVRESAHSGCGFETKTHGYLKHRGGSSVTRVAEAPCRAGPGWERRPAIRIQPSFNEHLLEFLHFSVDALQLLDQARFLLFQRTQLG